MRKYFASLLYPLTVPVVGVVALALVSKMERSIGLVTWRYVGDVSAMFFIVVLGIPIFIFATRALVRFNATADTRRATHLAHCFFIYLVAFFLGFFLSTNTDHVGGLGYGIAGVVFVVCAIAVVCNLVAIYLVGVKNA